MELTFHMIFAAVLCAQLVFLLSLPCLSLSYLFRLEDPQRRAQLLTDLCPGAGGMIPHGLVVSCVSICWLISAVFGLHLWHLRCTETPIVLSILEIQHASPVTRLSSKSFPRKRAIKIMEAVLNLFLSDCCWGVSLVSDLPGSFPPVFMCACLLSERLLHCCCPLAACGLRLDLLLLCIDLFLSGEPPWTDSDCSYP